MADTHLNAGPRNRPSGHAHHRSQSSPYFQHTRTFTALTQPSLQNEFGSRNDLPVTTKASTFITAVPQKPTPARLQKHNRSLTSITIPPRPPVITTNIKVESAPAVLPSSIFSGASPIHFDLSPPESPNLSPLKDKWSFIPSFKADKRLPERASSPSRIFNWFQGESAPVALGIASSPVKEVKDPFQSTQMPLDARSILEYSKSSKANNVLSSLFTGKTSTTVLVPQDVSNDEHYNLDIKQALQPNGQADPFSPSSFKNLQQNAEGLLARMQVAYRQRVLTIRTMKAEKEAQEEEYEEAKTRADHLKTQLDSLSSCLDNQNQEIQRLMGQLREERRLRKEEADRNRTIRLVQNDHPYERRMRSRTSLGSTMSTPSILSDAELALSETSEPSRLEDCSFTSPATPKSQEWPQNHHFELSNIHKAFEEIPHVDVDEKPTGDFSDDGPPKLIRENIELRTRVGHLEKELDNCLEILQGFGL